MQSVSWSRSSSNCSMRWSSSLRHSADIFAHSALVGVLFSGSAANALATASSGMPTRCATRITASRRSTSRAKRRWLPAVRRLRIRPLRS